MSGLVTRAVVVIGWSDHLQGLSYVVPLPSTQACLYKDGLSQIWLLKYENILAIQGVRGAGSSDHLARPYERYEWPQQVAVSSELS